MKKILSVALSVVFCFIAVLPVSMAEASRDLRFEKALAGELKELGLFKGVSDTDFALDRAPTRTEALVMLIRLLGKDAEAQNGDWSHPFVDVDGWADKYVGYAYENALTKGVSADHFGTGDASANMYLTFTLRALGYSDENGDFSWDNPFPLARTLGVLDDTVSIKAFLRADAVVISHNALAVRLKDSTETLAQKLIADGVFTQSQYDATYDQSDKKDANEKKTDDDDLELTAKEIYAKCSSAVFYIETYDVEGNFYASGSGFFLDESGIAVTNHHVLENALSATITLTDGTTYPVKGVLEVSSESDLAVIKIDGSNFDTLKTGDSLSLSGGETIYTISSPLGLKNTISNGIVSNPRRSDVNDMIQITAPISPGSSGGALVNGYGEVIGITTAYLEDGQNLNFAAPIDLISDIEELRGLVQEGKIISLREYAALEACRIFENIPDAFQDNVEEIEPNDSVAQAYVIENGTSVWGVVDDGMLDLFLVYCNTPGEIGVVLFSDSERPYVEDLVLTVSKYEDFKDAAEAEFYALDDGTTAWGIIYKVSTPGIYVIGVFSYELYEDEEINTDYSFYYKFTPELSKKQ